MIKIINKIIDILKNMMYYNRKLATANTNGDHHIFLRRKLAKTNFKKVYMCFVLVGGHDRMHREYIQIGKAHGHKVKVFTHLTARFAKSIGSPDAILIFTSTLSHKMLIVAEKEAKRKKIPVVKSHSSSGMALKRSIREAESMMKECV